MVCDVMSSSRGIKLLEERGAYSYFPGNWRQQVSPKCWCLPTKLHDVTSQSTVLIILTTWTSSKLICL
jgi:hypothetical protein